MGCTRGVLASAAGLVMILAGCGAGRQGDSAATATAAAATAPATAGKAAVVTVRLVDHAGLMEVVEHHRGKIVVLDCWSTSCPPCVKEFPGLVKLAAARGDRVQCLSLCFDYDGVGQPEDLVPPVKAFLEKVGAGRVVNLLSSEEADSLYRKLDLASVPAICYDDELAARDLGRPFTYADVERTVAELPAP
jgi:thiol-disulfide isomerase/thioredoxin